MCRMADIGMRIEMDEMKERRKMKGREYHRTRVNKESKKELELNGIDAMEWNERIGMEMDDNRNEWQEWVVMRVMEVK